MFISVPILSDIWLKNMGRVAFVDRSTAEDSVPDGSHRIMLFQNTLSSIFSKYVILKQKIYNSIPSFFMVQLEITEY